MPDLPQLRVYVCAAGGLARLQLDSSDVRGASSGRRHTIQRRSTIGQGMESPDPRHQMGRRGTVQVYDQYQPGQEQTGHATRERCSTYLLNRPLALTLPRSLHRLFTLSFILIH